MKKIILLSLFLLSIVFSGCTSVSVSPDEVTVEQLQEKRCEENSCFIASQYFSEIDLDENVSLLIKTNGKEFHLLNYLGTTELNPSEILFFENPTTTNIGTQIPSYDLQRNNPQNSTAEIYINPTISNFGTLINQNYLFGQRKVATKFDEINHFILKKNTTYLFTFVSRENNNKALLKLKWYEK